jgi:hypothetical protein
MSRDPYDGRPYYCVSCGEKFDEHCVGGDCIMESTNAAQNRARKRRTCTSDLAHVLREQQDKP